MFERHLSQHFGQIRSIQRLVLPVSVLLLKLPGGDFTVTIRRVLRKRFAEWRIGVDPLAYPGLWKKLPKEEERKYAKDLLLISTEIHALLTSVPGITRVRWFFEGWNLRRPGVRTPAELPWYMDVPELRGAEKRKMS
jgi:hypothetical protein